MKNSSSAAISTVYDRVQHILASAQNDAARSVNSAQVAANWLIGREIVEEQQQGAKRAGYGEKVVPRLALELRAEGVTGYGELTLRLCRQFYLTYSALPGPEICYALRNKSATLTARTKIRYAVRKQLPPLATAKCAALVPQIIEAARAAASQPGQSWQPGRLHPGLSWTHYRALLSNLQAFLLELGKGFAFVARQQRLTLEGDHFYVDLVFYHTVLKCHVLIDLKVHKLSHQDLGQLQLYVNYYDRERRTPGDNPTLGLILCTDKNDTAVKYTLGTDQKNIFASRYQFHLPTEADLAAEIRRELALMETPAPAARKRSAGKHIKTLKRGSA